MKKRVLFVLLTLAMLLAVMIPSAAALKPYGTPSAAYQQGSYYQNLLELELTGDQRTDMILVALSQLGYHEGNSNADLDGRNSGGSRNFTEYNVLFGKLDNGEGNGTSYGYAWCAAFVNWCLRQARVDQELTGGMYVSCASWRNWFIYEGKAYGASYHARTDDYVPKKGDLIFYKSLSATHNRATDHIGIVLKCEDGKVYTIEGNADNKVGLHEYDLTNPYIVGYGSIAYKTADVPEVDYYATENHLPGLYIAGNGAVSVYAGASSSTEKITTLPSRTVYRITAVQGKFGSVILEDGSTGWISLRRLTPMTAEQHYTVEVQMGEQSIKAVVAQGASWRIPEMTLDAQALGLQAAEGGELYMPGQILTPVADMVLAVAYPVQTETETETYTDAETEAVTQGEQATQQLPAQDESVTPDAPLTEEQSTNKGCNGTVSAAFMGLLIAIGAAFAIGKKRNG
jgi:hypothetical protein